MVQGKDIEKVIEATFKAYIYIWLHIYIYMKANKEEWKKKRPRWWIYLFNGVHQTLYDYLKHDKGCKKMPKHSFWMHFTIERWAVAIWKGRAQWEEGIRFK